MLLLPRRALFPKPPRLRPLAASGNRRESSKTADFAGEHGFDFDVVGVETEEGDALYLSEVGVFGGLVLSLPFVFQRRLPELVRCDSVPKCWFAWSWLP